MSYNNTMKRQLIPIVEEVLDMKTEDGVRYLYIKWQDLDPMFNEWVSEEKLPFRGKVKEYLLKPNEVTDMFFRDKQLFFVMQTLSQTPVVISRDFGHNTCPHLLLDYYEKKLVWKTGDIPREQVLLSDRLFVELQKFLLNQNSERGTVIHNIYGCLKTSRGLYFLVDWANGRMDFVHSYDFHLYHTIVALAYYESRIVPTPKPGTGTLLLKHLN